MKAGKQTGKGVFRTAVSHSSQGEITGFARIAVVGVGLIGASLSAAVKQVAPHTYIVGADMSQSAREGACERGWVDLACLPDDPAFEHFVRTECDLFVLAVPAFAAEPYFASLAAWSYAGVVTDTSSTKARISALAAETLLHPERYVPGHPMAGSEVNGIQGARSDLFRGAHWILCPDADTPPEDFQRLHELITSLGARVVSLAREEHDGAVAVVSHVPHVVASALMKLACDHADERRSLMRLAAGGFKDSTRIAAGSPKLWCGIAFDNEHALVDGIAEMEGILAHFREALSSGNRTEVTRFLTEAAEARRALPAEWVPSTERLLEVRIPMENRRGVLAEATTIASSVGCNIQSIEIDHITEDTALLSLVLTDEGDIGQLSAKLIDAGFSVSFSPLSAKEHSHVG